MIKQLNLDDVLVSWSGEYPNLCSGNWNIQIMGFKLSGIGRDEFNTYGEYDTWSFGDDWSEEWEQYSDGLSLNEWVEYIKESNHNNLIESLKKSNIEPNNQVLSILFEKIQPHDWRHNSCGGCI